MRNLVGASLTWPSGLQTRRQKPDPISSKLPSLLWAFWLLFQCFAIHEQDQVTACRDCCLVQDHQQDIDNSIFSRAYGLMIHDNGLIVWFLFCPTRRRKCCSTVLLDMKSTMDACYGKTIGPLSPSW